MTQSNATMDFLQGVFRFGFRLMLDVAFKLIYRTQAIGRENIPKKGGVLVACNHISAVDTMLVPYMALDRFTLRQFYAPAKEELFKYRPMAWFFRAGGAFPVKRGRRDDASRDKIAELTKEHLMMIFPEGTRSKNGKLLPGKTGVGKIIYESRVPVLPTIVINTNYCLPKGSWSPIIFLPFKVVFGKPLDFGRFYDMPAEKATYRAIVDNLMDEIRKLQLEYMHLDIQPERLEKSEPENA